MRKARREQESASVFKVRVPTAKHTDWHKDKSKYTRKRKHKKTWR